MKKFMFRLAAWLEGWRLDAFEEESYSIYDFVY
jgi:hypothetical protein